MAEGQFRHPDGGHHECEILGRGSEAAESLRTWDECKKNPGHAGIISVQDFIDKHLPKLQSDKRYAVFQAIVDLTVRLRVNWTSPERPNEDNFSILRGTGITRMGTGFIRHIEGPVCDKPCLCGRCGAERATKTWKITVQTAHHVLYNTEEAKETKVDLFYNENSSNVDDTVTGLEVVGTEPARDVCHMLCVTHDGDLAERINSAWRSWLDRGDYLDLSGLDLLPSRDGDDGGGHPTLIVSHPHGQPKKVAVGKGRAGERRPLVEYTAATCPGSSGAPVFGFVTGPSDMRYPLWIPSIHSGSYGAAFTQHRENPKLQARNTQGLEAGEAKVNQRNYGNWL
ncbi:hypothetical protein EGW08_013798 [Elysia chlorotica]|uniref:Peptidase S1 domain-containing protein n=1 Tax=Elysia chlorotica TaxID=188477 RepID=A0A3S1B9M7_ELYCH|nr:hypothetical protein EGW08_013798 [Elysia chlorotica]